MLRTYDIPAEERARLFAHLALAWDGQWFLKVADEFGVEAAVRLNARVRQSFGRIEMRRMLRLVGKKRADDLPDAVAIMSTYMKMMTSGWMDIREEMVDDGREGGRAEIRLHIHRCPILENVRKANVGDNNQCCVACAQLWPAYLQVLLPDETVDYKAAARMGMGDPACRFEFRSSSEPRPVAS